MTRINKLLTLRRTPWKDNPLRNPVAISLAVASLWTATMQAQVTLDPAWRVTPDTTKPGFKWSYFQAGVNTGNNNERTESDLAGLSTYPNQGDPTSVGAAITEAAPADPANGLLYFEITNVINLSKTDGGAGGYFPGDQLEPGINLLASTDGQSAEILSYLTLPVGTNFMGVRSDDGFRCESGPNPQDIFGRRIVNERPGGAGDLVFEFVVPPGGAGTYPFRVIWENGGGDSHVEWYTADSLTPTTRVLVNDVANGGIPAYRAISGALAAPPYVKTVTPLPVLRQTEGPRNKVTVVLVDGTNPVNTNSITLRIDGNLQTPTITRSGSSVTVDSGVLAGLRLAGETHTAVLTFNDTGTYSRTQQWGFMNLENLILPATPVAGENFDSYPESSSRATTVPPGWIATNHTYVETPGWDLTDVTSDAYLDFVMISTNTVLGIAAETLQNDQTQTINGIPLTNLDNWMSGNLLHAASDSRLRNIPNPIPGEPNISVGQINFAISAPFNLSSAVNPVLTFSSGARLSGNKEQMTLEYSIDNGATWLPGIYMRNSTTVRLLPNGSFDAVTMCTEMDTNQIAMWPTPGVGPKGGNFGDMIAAPISQALAPYFANRNDGPAARRVEAIRLPRASKQSNVRLRFTHAGSCGWDWGIDNIAFYDVAPPRLITEVVEAGGDNEPTDTIAAKWTGQIFPVSVANEPLPGLVVGNNYAVGSFGNGAPAFVDRNHTYTNASGTVLIPSYLAGGEYIMSGNDNRDNTNLTMQVFVSKPVQAYLLIDNRLNDGDNATPPTFTSTNMQWVVDQGWAAVRTGNNRTGNPNVPDEVGIDEGTDGTINNWYSVYTKAFPAGSFQLKQADNAGRNMYGTVITLQPPRVTITPQGANVVITFPTGYRLQRASAVTGPWTDVVGASPVTEPATANQQYYRGISP